MDYSIMATIHSRKHNEGFAGSWAQHFSFDSLAPIMILASQCLNKSFIKLLHNSARLTKEWVSVNRM
jgi:hypothetical protein